MTLKEVDLTPWMTIARKEIGVSEVHGIEHNERIVEYAGTTLLKATDDETPWCSSFVNWCITKAGIVGTKSAAARSWLKWGADCGPKIGCIVILKRGDSEKSGHVGFLERFDPAFVYVLGGNQKDQVNVSRYFRARVLGYKWPTT